MSWIGKIRENCATFEDVVLFCPVLFQMFSRCVPVHPYVIVLFQHFFMLCEFMYLCGSCDYFYVFQCVTSDIKYNLVIILCSHLSIGGIGIMALYIIFFVQTP